MNKFEFQTDILKYINLRYPDIKTENFLISLDPLSFRHKFTLIAKYGGLERISIVTVSDLDILSCTDNYSLVKTISTQLVLGLSKTDIPTWAMSKLLGNRIYETHNI